MFLVGPRRPHPRWGILISSWEQWVLLRPLRLQVLVVTRRVMVMVPQGLLWPRWQPLQFQRCPINPSQSNQIDIGHQSRTNAFYFYLSKPYLLDYVNTFPHKETYVNDILLQPCPHTKDGVVPQLPPKPTAVPVVPEEQPAQPVEPA